MFPKFKRDKNENEEENKNKELLKKIPNENTPVFDYCEFIHEYLWTNGITRELISIYQNDIFFKNMNIKNIVTNVGKTYDIHAAVGFLEEIFNSIDPKQFIIYSSFKLHSEINELLIELYKDLFDENRYRLSFLGYLKNILDINRKLDQYKNFISDIMILLENEIDIKDVIDYLLDANGKKRKDYDVDSDVDVFDYLWSIDEKINSQREKIEHKINLVQPLPEKDEEKSKFFSRKKLTTEELKKKEELKQRKEYRKEYNKSNVSNKRKFIVNMYKYSYLQYRELYTLNMNILLFKKIK